MDNVLRPSNAIGAAILGVIGLLVLMMSQAATQVQVNVQAQPRQNARQVITVVIADDELDQLAETSMAIGVVIQALGYEPRILPALSIVQTITLSKTGNNGGQVNAVFLDGGYGVMEGFDWWLPENAPIDADDLATGNALAALLRAEGYSGPIILVSRLPDDYLGKPGGDNFALGLKKAHFWANPMKFLEALRSILK